MAAACLLFAGVALLVHGIFKMTDRRPDPPSNRDDRRKNRR
ncbi:MAG TPA: hypothetical protein VGH34_00640 [Vicinamibacterales bacterium]